MIVRLILIAAVSVLLPGASLSLPDLRQFSFVPTMSRILPGLAQEDRLEKGINDNEQIGRLALAALRYQKGCWTDGRYNHNDYLVEQGGMAVPGSEQSLEAYRIHEPARKATKFLGSHHGIYYRFPSREAWAVYQLDQDLLKRVALVPAEQVEPGRLIRVGELKVSTVKGSVTYVFAPARLKLSTYWPLAKGVEGARLAATPLGDLLLARYDSTAALPDPHKDKAQLTRQFFPVRLAHGPAIIWQDRQSQVVQISRFARDLRGVVSIPLAGQRPGRLLAACADQAGNLYYLLARAKDDPELLELIKTDPGGNLLARSTPDCSPSGLNIHSMGSEAAELGWSNGRLCLMLMRTMNRSADGLNHQGGIAAIFADSDLKLIRNLGQTSGHSFDNQLLITAGGEFIGLDLGDNFPRGINLHSLSEKRRSSRVVYTFKTEHGRSPSSRAGVSYPEYPEISTPQRSYYKWSNDNATYTELGGVVETPRGYAVVFAGEPSPEGRVLDNSRAGAQRQDLRNIGLVLAVKDFDKLPDRGSEVPDGLLRSTGTAENGGFYNYRGNWSRQRTYGVIWLTRYTAEEGLSARHIKVAPLSDGTILILWESAQKGVYRATWGMTVDADGRQIVAPFRLPSQLRLTRRDAILFDGAKVYIASGDSVEGKLELFVLQLKADPQASRTAQTTAPGTATP